MPRSRRSRFRQNTIAMVYDFDGTLTPQPMQEYTVLPKLGSNPKKFWEDVKKEASRTGADEMLTYMRLLIERLNEARQHLTPEDLRGLARRIRYSPGVRGWFPRIDRYVRRVGGRQCRVQHYLISAGLREILDGATVRRHFHRVYASEYYFDFRSVAKFAKRVVNDTAKTQFLFRINKGRLNYSDSINEYMPETERPIPFPNIIYIGDGMTDVPCMTVTRKNGGHAVAVHPPRARRAIATCRKLLRADRIDFYAPADFRPARLLERRVQLILRMVVAGIEHSREVYECRRAVR